MKQILTLLMVLGAMAGANAQSFPGDRNDSREVILGQSNDRTYENNSRYESNGRYANNYSFTAFERDRQLERINRDYDFRIRQVDKDRWIRGYEKSYKIRRLEEQRRDEIRLVWERYRNNRNQYRDNDYRKNDRRW